MRADKLGWQLLITHHHCQSPYTNCLVSDVSPLTLLLDVKFLRRSVRRAHQLHELGPTLRFGKFMELMSTPLSAPWNFPCGRPGRRDGVPIPVLQTIFCAEHRWTMYL